MTSVTIRDLVHVSGGGTPRRSNGSYYGGSIPWVTPKDMKRPTIVSSEITLTADGVANSPAKWIPAGSILVVVRSGVLKHTLPVALTGVPVTVNQDMKALTPSPGVDARYLARRIKALEAVVLGQVRATTADNFPIDILLDIAIDLPPLEEQRRVASILDHASALRAKRRLVLTQLGSLPSRRFDEAFAGRAWHLVPMSDLIAEQQIGLDRRSSEQGADRAHGYLKMDVITRDGQLDLTRLTNVDASVDEAKRYAVRDGDLLLNTRNSRELVGKSAVYHGPPCLYNNNLSRIRFSEQVTPQYIHGFLWSLDGRRQLESRKSGTTSVFAMYAKAFATILVPIPPIEDQIAFANFVTEIENRQSEVRRLLKLDDSLFASLQRRAFLGEL
ncbi:hypothetical protein C5C39_02485 [Rathayibacter sp. AY1F3]|uniref:restriction endonuclease subunit S n=1 Tax=Rathayibacter sp. AY1F3 TaxID=2080558 RepID=UPI000CE92242|nr:restriction endonuclease subunit S [Rathayibacter sp. AY1F3]PPG92894.1 hypothetical protein C5C39_02485 [Rathayibacter sp. AY1F3]